MATCPSTSDGSTRRLTRQQRLQRQQCGLVLRIELPGVDVPSRNLVNSAHWSDRHRLRRLWTVYLARALCGSHGSALVDTTMTIEAGPSARSVDCTCCGGEAQLWRVTASRGGRGRCGAVGAPNG